MLMHINNIYIFFVYYKISFLVCANATYLKQEYGFSVTVTYNSITIINTTMSGNLNENF